MPLVSVIITAYNNERHIAAAIESVLSQSWTDYELIIAEDCGVDNTYDIATSFTDRRVSVFRNERNLGQHRNKNAGLAKACGSLIKFVDGDDILEPGGLEKLIAVFQSYSGQASTIFGRTRYIDDEGNSRGSMPLWGVSGMVRGDVLLQHIASNIGFGGCPFGNVTGHLFTRESLHMVGGFPNTNTYAGDCETFFKLLAISNVAFTDEAVAAYRRQPKSLSATTSALSQLQDAFVSIHSLQAFFSGLERPIKEFEGEEFRRGIVAAFTKHLVASQVLRAGRGRSNCFAAMKDLFEQKGCRRELRYLLWIESWRYYLALLSARLRERLGLEPRSTFSLNNQ